MAIFKGSHPDRYAHATDLGMVVACVIGDIINIGKNLVAAINTEGWLYIFDMDNPVNLYEAYGSCAYEKDCDSSSPMVSGDFNVQVLGSEVKTEPRVGSIKLIALYEQRMPANCKELLLADLDGDGENEVIVGLTDRVLRTYKWIKIGPDRGKFVGLYKWEFADQIGAVSLNPSRHENCQDIIVAQPGGTYAKLECFDKKPTMTARSSTHSPNDSENMTEEQQQQTSLVGSPDNDDNVRTEYISKLTPEYHQLALAQMRNHHISTEVLGGIKDGKDSDSYSLIVVATLDGTLMLVNKDEILWSLQVDHQLFAIAILESDDSCHFKGQQVQSAGGRGANIDGSQDNSDHPLASKQSDGDKCRQNSQYFVVCAWNGKTYIIDEDRNYLRFKFDEAVSAFTAGSYHFDGSDHSSLVYATFNNQIVLYFDVILDQIRPMYLLEEVLNNPDNSDLLSNLETLADHIKLISDDKVGEADDRREGDQSRLLHNLLYDILYSIDDEDLTS